MTKSESELETLFGKKSEFFFQIQKKRGPLLKSFREKNLLLAKRNLVERINKYKTEFLTSWNGLTKDSTVEHETKLIKVKALFQKAIKQYKVSHELQVSQELFSAMNNLQNAGILEALFAPTDELIHNHYNSVKACSQP